MLSLIEIGRTKRLASRRT